MIARVWIALALTATLTGCGAKKEKVDAPEAPVDQPDLPTPDGFNSVAVSLAGTVAWNTDAEAHICDGKAVGTAYLMQDLPALIVCEGTFAPIGGNHAKLHLASLPSRLPSLQNLYLGVFTDEIDDMTDVSVVLIEESAETITPHCDSTHFSKATMSAGISGAAARKGNADQVRGLSKAKGVCDAVRLARPDDLTKVIVTDGAAEPKRMAQMTLTHVYP